jgi:tetratricopeptide (TPR) repeat protein
MGKMRALGVLDAIDKVRRASRSASTIQQRAFWKASSSIKVISMPIQRTSTIRFFPSPNQAATGGVFAHLFHRVFGLASLIVLVGVTSADDPKAPEPRVASVQMRLTFSEDLVDVIEKGDLLTVLEDRDENFLVQTFSGRKGLVAKANAVALPDSVSIYSELIEATPDQGRLFTLRAGALWAAGQSDAALEDFNKAIELGYDEGHAFMSRGLLYAARREHDKAIEDYTKAIEKEPSDPAPLINRAAAFLLTNRVDEAVADYTKALELRKDDPLLFQQRAIAYKSIGKLDQAVADFSKAVELAGNDKLKRIPPLGSRAYLYFQQGKHEEAVRDFSEIIELNPKATVAYNSRGYNLFQLERAVDALRDYDKAIDLEPKYGLAHQNRAWLLATTENKDIRNPEAAIESATKACELSEYNDVSDMASLAAAHAANREFEKAVGWQEKVIEKATPNQKAFAEKILELYLANKPFDPKLAQQLLSGMNRSAEKSTEAPAPPPVPPTNKKRSL